MPFPVEFWHHKGGHKCGKFLGSQRRWGMVYFRSTSGELAQFCRLFLKRFSTYTGAGDTQESSREGGWEQG